LATISGKVVDDSGAGLPDLKVIAANQSSGAEKEVRSDPDGSYSLEIEPGTYAVRVEKTGMGRAGIRDVQIAAGDKRVVTLEIASRTDNRNFRYMFYGFIAAWLVLVIYVVSLVARERGLRKQIDNLKHMVESERR
jgi:CcmD family protein